MNLNELFTRYELASENVVGVEKLTEQFAMKERELALGDVTSEAADYINTFIRFWNRIDELNDVPVNARKPIKIYIDSGGGSVTAGFSIIDSITLSKTPVWTINIGAAYSAALEIFVAGHRRIAYPKSTFLFHEGSSGFEGDANKFRNFSKFYETLLDTAKEHILSHTKIGEELYDRHQKDDWWLTADDALEYGICDEITKELL